MDGPTCLVLRLAGPLQSWGYRSQFTYRETGSEPTKSGVIGLLAAAEGRRRDDPIKDLVGLSFGVRVDQPGSLLRDYHTVSDYTGENLPSTAVDRKGRQKRSSYPTQVTQRFYLQDAVFVAALEGDPALLAGLAEAIRQPGFPLALGRRACVPTLPILLTPADEDIDGQRAGDLWQGTLTEVLTAVPWKAADHHRGAVARSMGHGEEKVRLPVTLDEPDSSGTEKGQREVLADVPTSFVPRERAFTTRTVRRTRVDVDPRFSPKQRSLGGGPRATSHDPLALLGW